MKPVWVAAKGSVTIRHLLSHTSGYVYDFGGEGPLQDAYRKAKLWDATSLDDFVARVAALPLHHQPGTEFQYGISSDILGAVVEKAAGRPLEAFVEERLLAPLGMSDTGFDVPDAKRTRLAKTYTRDTQGRLVEAEAFSSSYAEPGRGFPSGGGGMFSTAGDYARFAQMLLNGGELDGERVLGRRTVRAMGQNHASRLPYPVFPAEWRRHLGCAMGLGMRTVADEAAVGINGSLGTIGWSGLATTDFWVDPQEELIGLFLTQMIPDTGAVHDQYMTLVYQALV